MISLRDMGRVFFKYLPGEKLAFKVYQEILNIWTSKRILRQGYYDVKYSGNNSIEFEIWSPVNGPMERKKISGKYESQVASELLTRGSGSEILIVGGGFGYHAIGIANQAESITVVEADPERADRIRNAVDRQNIRNINIYEERIVTGQDLVDFLPANIVVVDIEGYEDEVLEIEPQHLHKADCWIVEIHEHGILGPDRYADGENISNRFERAGFNVDELSRRKEGNYHLICH